MKVGIIRDFVTRHEIDNDARAYVDGYEYFWPYRSKHSASWKNCGYDYKHAIVMYPHFSKNREFRELLEQNILKRLRVSDLLRGKDDGENISFVCACKLVDLSLIAQLQRVDNTLRIYTFDTALKNAPIDCLNCEFVGRDVLEREKQNALSRYCGLSTSSLLTPLSIEREYRKICGTATWDDYEPAIRELFLKNRNKYRSFLEREGKWDLALETKQFGE